MLRRPFLKPTPRKGIYLLSLVFVVSFWYFCISREDSDILTPFLQTPTTQPDEVDPLPSDLVRRDAVVEMFKTAWHAYERDAIGSDEYRPISHNGYNLSWGTGGGGIGYTIVDAIDTMYLMGLTEEYSRARKWISDSLSFDIAASVSFFETTIRVLGGLLSIYQLTEDRMYLSKAVDLGDRMITQFQSPVGFPTAHVTFWKSKHSRAQSWRGTTSLAEIGTLQLEFKYLSILTGNREYWKKVEDIMKVIAKSKKPYPGLAPVSIFMNDGSFRKAPITMGTNGDSYYEYLLKQYLLTGRGELVYKSMWREAMDSVHLHMVQRTQRHRMAYLPELLPYGPSYQVNKKQEHLSCFLPGALLLGATTAGASIDRVSRPPKLDTELSESGRKDWNLGMELLQTCMTIHQTKTGLAPEWVRFNIDEEAQETDWKIERTGWGERYLLRPEILESVFIAWRLTGDQKYRDFAWGVYESIEKYCHVPMGMRSPFNHGPPVAYNKTGPNTNGYATVLDVDRIPVRLDDKQETFFLSETLKYLYLTFTDSSVIPLDRFVFNTEAHPFPVFKAPKWANFSP